MNEHLAATAKLILRQQGPGTPMIEPFLAILRRLAEQDKLREISECCRPYLVWHPDTRHLLCDGVATILAKDYFQRHGVDPRRALSVESWKARLCCKLTEPEKFVAEVERAAEGLEPPPGASAT